MHLLVSLHITFGRSAASITDSLTIQELLREGLAMLGLHWGPRGRFNVWTGVSINVSFAAIRLKNRIILFLSLFLKFRNWGYFFSFFGREDKIQDHLALNKQLWLWKPSQASTWIMKAGPSRPAAAPARDRSEILSLCEMLEREADQAFPWLLDMSLSFTPAWVTRDPITLPDPPPPVRIGPALTQVGECKRNAPVLTLAYHRLQRCAPSQINAIVCIIHSKMMHLISKIFAATLRKVCILK